MTIQDVARHLGVSWDVIKEIQKRSLKRRFSRPKLKKLKRIAIDEITSGHGHRYLTIVLDLDSGAVVFVGEGKGVEALELNKPLATAYCKKEDLRELWNQPSCLPVGRIKNRPRLSSKTGSFVPHLLV